MKKTLWDVIKESKGEKEFVTSRTHYKKLEKVLASLDEENAKQVAAEWGEKLSELRKFKFDKKENEEKGEKDIPEFEKLHKEDGGFVNSGDDGFYMDFGNWLVAQGEGLYNAFLTKGHEAVIEYKKKHKVQKKDYQYECMGYVLHPYFD